MRGKQITFYAEQQDLRQLITAFEATTQCHYYEAGAFETSRIPTYTSLLDIPTLGTARTGDWNHATRLLLLPIGATLATRTVPQRAGGVRYFIDQLVNPQSMLLTLGGTFQPGVLIASGASTLATDAASLALYGSWAKLVKKFKRVAYAYVGHQAHAHLQGGWRLVTSIASPPDSNLPKTV